ASTTVAAAGDFLCFFFFFFFFSYCSGGGFSGDARVLGCASTSEDFCSGVPPWLDWCSFFFFFFFFFFSSVMGSALWGRS
ncbi:hypothetical protein L195_g062061, partial [Trifolium pratense]